MKMELTKNCNFEDTSKIKELIMNFDVNIVNKSKNFMDLLENSTYLLNFIINLQETILELRNKENLYDTLKDILQDAEIKIQYFENKFVFNCNVLCDEYKSVIEEKNNNIVALYGENDVKSYNLNKIDSELLNIYGRMYEIQQEIHDINNKIKSETSIRKNLDLKQFTIKKLGLHIGCLSAQRDEIILEKDEALEELTACNQMLEQKDISRLKSLSYEIRRANGEINTLNKQINIVTNLKLDVENSYQKNSLELLEQINYCTLRREKLLTELNLLEENATDSLNNISFMQQNLENLARQNTEQIKLYWKNIKQIQIKWYNLDNQLKKLQYNGNKLISSLPFKQNTLKECIINYKKQIRINDEVKVEYIITKLSKLFQEFQNRQTRILAHLEYLIIGINSQNAFARELGYVSEFSAQFDTVVHNLVIKLNDFKNKTDLFKNYFFNLRIRVNIDKLENLEERLVELCEDITDLEQKEDELSAAYDSYIIFNNNKVKELQSHYNQILNNCQNEIVALNSTINFSQHKLKNLKEIKKELSKEIDTLINEKERYVEKIQLTYTNLEQNIAIISEDKVLLNSKLELITRDFIKLKTLHNRRDYGDKLNEILETRSNIKYVIKLITNLQINLIEEWNISCTKLNNAKESLFKSKTKLADEIKIKHNLYLDLQTEIFNLKERMQSVANLKCNIEKSSELLNKKVLELQNKMQKFVDYKPKINDRIDLKLQELEQKLASNNNGIQQKIDAIEILNSQLRENIGQLKNLTRDKNNLLLKLSEVRAEYLSLQQNYRRIIEFEVKFAPKMQQFILETHNLNPNLLDYIINQVSLFISIEKQRVDILKRRLLDFYLLKDNVCELCLEFYVQIATFSTTHSLQQQIMQSIHKLKTREAELENYLQNLHSQKEKIDKNYYLTLIEQEILLSLSNIKTDKTYLEITNQLENLQLECINHQNRIMDKCSTNIQESFSLWQYAINNKKDNFICSPFDEPTTKLIKNLNELTKEIKTKDEIIIKRENDIVELKAQYQEELDKITSLEQQINTSTCDLRLVKHDNKFLKTEEIISVLNAQLWTTVHKYVDLEIENNNLREQLNFYQNVLNVEAENTLHTLKLYLWVIANKYNEMKDRNRKLCQIIGNMSRRQIYTGRYILIVFILILIYFSCKIMDE